MAHNRFVRAIDDPSKFRLDEIIATASARLRRRRSGPG